MGSHVSAVLNDAEAVRTLRTKAGLRIVGKTPFEQHKAVGDALRSLVEEARANQPAAQTQQSDTVAQDNAEVYNDNINEREDMNNEREEQGVHLRRSSQRSDGSHTDGQVSAVEESSGRNQSWNNKSGRGRRNRIRSIRAAVDALRLRRRSAKSLGIESGTDKGSCYVAPESVLTQEEIEVREKKRQEGIELVYVIGEMEVNEHGKTGNARGIVSADGKKMWVQIDNESAESIQIIKHEDFHVEKMRNPKLIKQVRAEILKKHNRKELKELVKAYIVAYNWRGVNKQDILEEIFADAYAGIDVFAEIEGLEGASRFSEEAREVAGSYGQSYSTASTAGMDRYSRNPEERRRALRKGEMINEFYDKINWHDYYEKLKSDEYNPDYYDDGDEATMHLACGTVTLVMKKNGEFSVKKLEEYYYGEEDKYIPEKKHRETSDANSADDVGDGRHNDGSELSWESHGHGYRSNRIVEGEYAVNSEGSQTDIGGKYGTEVGNKETSADTEEGKLTNDKTKKSTAPTNLKGVQDLVEKYGAIKPGEKPYRDVSVPKKTDDGRKVRRGARTSMEAEAVPDEFVSEMEQEIVNGTFSYEPIYHNGL